MEEHAYEVNLDGLVGPTHHYGGLAFGNKASIKHQHAISHPKEAALQGLAKMRSLMQLGIKQVVIPPHERPFLPLLYNIGYTQLEPHLLSHIYKQHPHLLLSCYSSAHMWTANAATVCPSIDSLDGKVHLTIANLTSKLHRSFESVNTLSILKAIFKDEEKFVIHSPLHSHLDFADEGAANHTRLCTEYGKPGIHLFAFGRYAWQANKPKPHHFPARQTYEASEAVSRLHRLAPEQILFIQQSPKAIDAGVFHNDVASVGNQQVFFYHQRAFIDTAKAMDLASERFSSICKAALQPIEVSEDGVPLGTAIRTYLFNSQLITLPNQTMALIAPIECQENETVRCYLENLLLSDKYPIKKVFYTDVRQSMRNGGGPACLRMRVVLTPKEYEALHPSVCLTEDLYNTLVQWVHRHYRDRLAIDDLQDPLLIQESYDALDELTQLLNLGSLYTFQRR